MFMETILNYHIDKYIYIIILIDSWSLGREQIHISIMKEFKNG